MFAVCSRRLSVAVAVCGLFFYLTFYVAIIIIIADYLTITLSVLSSIIVWVEKTFGKGVSFKGLCLFGVAGFSTLRIRSANLRRQLFPIQLFFISIDIYSQILLIALNCNWNLKVKVFDLFFPLCGIFCLYVYNMDSLHKSKTIIVEFRSLKGQCRAKCATFIEHMKETDERVAIFLFLFFLARH